MQALAATKDVDPATWREQVAAMQWTFCPSWSPGRPRPLAAGRRMLARPDHPVPYFAPRAGDVPADGTPTVAGITLPEGGPGPNFMPAYWRSYEPLGDPSIFTSALAAAFAETGLWPVLWEVEEDPVNYMGGHADLSPLGHIEPLDVLRTAWARIADYYSHRPAFANGFPGLARGTVTSGSRLPTDDPFARVNDLAARQSWRSPQFLILVPCNRPADALAVLDHSFSQIPNAVLATMLRSWEERFAAVPVQLDASGVTLHIGVPVTDPAEAFKLAIELLTITEEDSELERLAESLLHQREWSFAFQEETTAELNALATRHSSLTSTGASWSPPSC